jgi:hypothetical protein
MMPLIHADHNGSAIRRDERDDRRMPTLGGGENGR